MEAYFERFTIELTAEQARYGSQPGVDASPAIHELLQEPQIAVQIENIPASDLAAELKEYGAWDEEELKDIDDNRARILWIACGNVREEYKL